MAGNAARTVEPQVTSVFGELIPGGGARGRRGSWVRSRHSVFFTG